MSEAPGRLYILWDEGDIDDWAEKACEGCDHIEYIRADLARLPEWKPIDAAPRDRRILLAKIVGHPAHETAIWWVSIGEWSQRWDRWWDTVDPSGLAGPTHWMPLPRNVAGHEQGGGN